MKKIQNITKSNNAPSFKARFIFNGRKNEAAEFINFIKTELKNSQQPTDVFVSKKGNAFLILTTDDAIKADINDFSGINAAEFYDKKTKTFLKGIMSFDPSFGWYEKLFSIERKGITSYFTKTENPKEKPKVFPRMDFREPKDLTDAISSIASLAKKWGHDISVYEELKEHGIGTTKVNGLVGMGDYSIYFNVADGGKTVLKLSEHPCYPKKQEPFDHPAIINGYIPLGNKTIYFSFLPKAENHSEKRISENDVNSVIKAIKQKGYKTSDDLLPSSTRQVVFYQGKMYLCDVDCAKLPSGESRLFKRDYSKSN
jgi:hypothetical protein